MPDHDRFVLAVDCDGTIVTHEYPALGRPVPGALTWLRRLQDAGVRIILYTMRCDGKHGTTLTDAVEYLTGHGIELYGINCNPGQAEWTTSRKCYAHAYLDDAAVGCPLVENPGGRPYVDWDVAGPLAYRLATGRDWVAPAV